MGRIRRIGNDTVTNYTFQATTAYDAANPAATASAWPDSLAMDQDFADPSPLEVQAEGVLITFSRFPDTFEGAMVKIKPVYNTTTNEDPFFELWTHDSGTNLWTKRRRIELSNLFVGVESNQRRIVDFTFFPFLRTVDKVWITMDPGSTGTPTMNFDAIQLFGQCEGTLVTPNPGGDIGDIANCIVHPQGVDETGTPCFTPGQDCSTFPEFCKTLPTLDLCSSASVELYEDALRVIPGALEEFQAWRAANADAIAQGCSGNTAIPTDYPVPPLPPLPPLNLCDDTSIDTFRAAIAGDAAQLTIFNDFIDSLTAAGFFDLTCPPIDPPEQYVDPNTLAPVIDPTTDEAIADPDTDNNTPFGSGPGGMPPADGSGDPHDSSGVGGGSGGGGGGGGGSVILERTTRRIFTWSGNDTATAVATASGLVAPLPASTATAIRSTGTGTWGPALGVSTVGLGYTPAAYAIRAKFKNLPFNCLIGIRMWVFRMRATPGFRFSISDAGIFTEPPIGFCAAGPDWIIANPLTITDGTSTLIGSNYKEFVFTGTGMVNYANMIFSMPRETPTQNDFDACVAGWKARSDLGFQRAGCLFDAFNKKLRARWICDVSTADYDAAPPFTFMTFGPPLAIIFDVTLRATLAGGGFDLGKTTISFDTLKDTQPTETCP